MEATYCVGNDVDVCRMFDQYLYKRQENLDLSLSVPHNFQGNSYDMNDQTFHTPSFGDEEFDIPAIQPQHGGVPSEQNAAMQSYQQQVRNMQSMQHHAAAQAQAQAQQHAAESMGMHGGAPDQGGYQQPLYLNDHSAAALTYHHHQQQQQQQQQHSPVANYPMQSPGGPQQLLMIQQQQMLMNQHGGHGQQYGRSPQHPQQGSSPPAGAGGGPEPATTSEDSDDSNAHPAMLAGMKRPSPEPAESLAKIQKKPKVQKKKKKRDPNEPQKPVSAYALFFRDTQAAIKGQNPNASFGEVSKIVASMWDALDTEHKNVYKKKTEAAKKEYLKALAAYRASLVSKGAGEGPDGGPPMYGGYGGGNPGGYAPPQYGGYSPQGALPSPPTATSPAANKKVSQQVVGPPQGQMMPPGMMGMHPMQVNASYIQGPVQQQSPHQQSPHQQHMQQQQQQQPHQSPHHQQPPHQSPHHPQHLSPPRNVNEQQQQQAPPPQQQQQHSMEPPSQSSVPNGGPNAGRPPTVCIRHGCPNPAIANAEWEDEYCSNECVVSHCRDVFSTWVASNHQNQSNQNFNTVK